MTEIMCLSEVKVIFMTIWKVDCNKLELGENMDRLSKFLEMPPTELNRRRFLKQIGLGVFVTGFNASLPLPAWATEGIAGLEGGHRLSSPTDTPPAKAPSCHGPKGSRTREFLR